MDVLELWSWGEVEPRRRPLFTCCRPDPTPAQLRRRAEDEWLDRQRQLAAEV